MFLRMTRGIKEMRQKVIVMQNPSEIDQNQLLLVGFPNLGSDDVIMNLPFNIKLPSMTELKRALVSNANRVLMKKLAFKFEGMRYWMWTISTCLRDTESCGRQCRRSGTQ